ncbi:nicotinamide N-methyltransferase-like [Gastrophryne carolinensis]
MVSADDTIISITILILCLLVKTIQAMAEDVMLAKEEAGIKGFKRHQENRNQSDLRGTQCSGINGRSSSLRLVIQIPKMESRAIKYYHDHDFHSRGYIDDYFCTASVFYDEALVFPMEKLYQLFKKTFSVHYDIETVYPCKGDLCIDISFGPLIHHLLSACDCFKEIILMRITDSCILETNRWLHDRTGAFSWNHTSSHLCEHKEMQLKNVIKHVMKCKLEEENITHPVETPQGDCVITTGLLEHSSKNQTDYVKFLRNILRCLKPGGRFILLGVLNGTYYTNNGEKFYVFKCDKEFVCSALMGERLIIDQCEVFPRCAMSDLCDFDGIIFISARKEK